MCDVDHQDSDGAGQREQTQNRTQSQALGFGGKPFLVGGKVDGSSDVLPHHKQHGRNKDVVFNIEGVKIVEAAGEHGASAGSAVAVRLWVHCGNTNKTSRMRSTFVFPLDVRIPLKMTKLT